MKLPPYSHIREVHKMDPTRCKALKKTPFEVLYLYNWTTKKYLKKNVKMIDWGRHHRPVPNETTLSTKGFLIDLNIYSG